MVLVIACVLTLVGSPRVFAEVGDTAVQPWRAQARAAVSVTMDDGYASQWRYMAPLLASRGFVGTFFIVTSWVDADSLWDDWRAVANLGHEVGSHSHTHLELPLQTPAKVAEELTLSRQRIQQELGPDHGQTFGYPFSKANPATVAAVKAAGYVAARTGGDRYNGDTPADPYLVQSRHPLTATPLWQINQWIDEIGQQGGWLVIGVHGVDDPENPAPPSHVGYEPVPLERYVAMVDHLVAAGSKLWVAGFGEVSRYVRYRDGAKIGSTSHTADGIEVVLLGATKGPSLSFRTEVPSHWVEVRVTTIPGDGGVLYATTADAQGGRYVLYEAVLPATVTIKPTAMKVGGGSDGGMGDAAVGDSSADAVVTDGPLGGADGPEDSGHDGGDRVDGLVGGVDGGVSADGAAPCPPQDGGCQTASSGHPAELVLPLMMMLFFVRIRGRRSPPAVGDRD